MHTVNGEDIITFLTGFIRAIVRSAHKHVMCQGNKAREGCTITVAEVAAMHIPASQEEKLKLKRNRARNTHIMIV